MVKNVIENLEKLKNELGVKYMQIGKALVEVVRKINEKGLLEHVREFKHDVTIKTSCWREGNVVRCGYATWGVVDGEIVIFRNADFTGLPDWTVSVEEFVKTMREKKLYKPLHEMAREFPSFIYNIIKDMEYRNKTLDETLTKLKVVLQILK